MDIFSYIKKDHRKVSEMFEELLAAHATHRRKSLFDQIKEELIIHSKSEEATFYKTLERDSELKAKLAHANKEHDEIEKYLESISNLSPESDKRLVMIGELKHAVEHHVNNEEKNIFPEAKKILSDEEARELAEEMDKLKTKLKEKT